MDPDHPPNSNDYAVTFTEAQNIVNLPNHHFDQYPQLASFSRPTFDVLKENFSETPTDWLHYESSGARHAYPSPGSLGQPIMQDPQVPIRSLPIYDSDLEDGKGKLQFPPIKESHSDSDESRYTASTPTLSDAPRNASVELLATPTKPPAKKVMHSRVTPRTQFNRSPWLAASVEQDRHMPFNKGHTQPSQQMSRTSTSTKVATKHLPDSPVSTSLRSSLSKRSNSSTATVLPAQPNVGPAADDPELSESERSSPESAPAMLVIPPDDESHSGITISSKKRPVSRCGGVTSFCLFEGASNAIVLNPPTILGSTMHPVNIGDIYFHTYTTVSGTSVQTWIFDGAGLWTDVTQALNARLHISHPKTVKLALWMKPGSPPNYIKLDTYKRYVQPV